MMLTEELMAPVLVAIDSENQKATVILKKSIKRDGIEIVCLCEQQVLAYSDFLALQNKFAAGTPEAAFVDKVCETVEQTVIE